MIRLRQGERDNRYLESSDLKFRSQVLSSLNLWTVPQRRVCGVSSTQTLKAISTGCFCSPYHQTCGIKAPTLSWELWTYPPKEISYFCLLSASPTNNQPYLVKLSLISNKAQQVKIPTNLSTSPSSSTNIPSLLYPFSCSYLATSLLTFLITGESAPFSDGDSDSMI